MHRDEWFTLIEVIIVGALIGILVAIGVPQLLRARLAANESSGIAALRAISSSEANYATTCGNGGYAVGFHGHPRISSTGRLRRRYSRTWPRGFWRQQPN